MSCEEKTFVSIRLPTPATAGAGCRLRRLAIVTATLFLAKGLMWLALLIGWVKWM